MMGSDQRNLLTDKFLFQNIADYHALIGLFGLKNSRFNSRKSQVRNLTFNFGY